MSAADDYDDGGPPLQVWPLTVAADLTVIYPALAVGAMYVEWLLAWAILGHQPRVSLDDPKDMPGSSAFGLFVFLLLMALPLIGCLGVALIVLGAMAGRLRGRRLLVRVIGFVMLWVGAFGLLQWDPLRVGEWWID